MGRVLALVPDLLFGSRVQASLAAHQYEVELIHGESRLRERLDRLRESIAPGRDSAGGRDLASGDGEARVVLVVDLTDEQLDGARIVRELRVQGDSAAADTFAMGALDLRTLGFYSHVDAPARERALQAGFDMVVPRSRMAREAPALVRALLS